MTNFLPPGRSINCQSVPAAAGSFRSTHQALRVRRSAFVLVLEPCCLQKRRVNPIRSAFPELHPRSGLRCSQGASSSSSSSNPAARSDGPPASLREALRAGVLEYCAKSELHPAPAGFGMLSGRHQPTDPGFHRLRASTSFDPGAYCSRTPRDTATPGEYKGSTGEWGIQPLWRVDSDSTHYPWSIHYPWNSRSPGCNSRYQICRKGRGTGEESPSSHFRLRPDVQSQTRRKDRKGEPQFFSSGHRFTVVWHKPDKKGSTPAHPFSQENLNSRKRTQQKKDRRLKNLIRVLAIKSQHDTEIEDRVDVSSPERSEDERELISTGH